ncbi:MAG TPA: CHAD domain-containing protein [Solirubrobacterales bacterium]|jgi:CHAD domain-containing protein
MKARRVEGLDPQGSLRSNSGRIVSTRLEELREHAQRAMEPGAEAAQHEMRIAAKRLRYVLEITGSCFGEEAAAARRAVKELQGVLGDIHDCDVMLPRVEGIPSLTTLLRARREQLFRDFIDLWEAEASRGTWAALERSL